MTFYNLQKEIQKVYVKCNTSGTSIDREVLTVLQKKQQEMFEQRAKNLCL